MSDPIRERPRVKGAEGSSGRGREGAMPAADGLPEQARRTVERPNALDFSLLRAIVGTEGKAFPSTSLRRHHHGS